MKPMNKEELIMYVRTKIAECNQKEQQVYNKTKKYDEYNTGKHSAYTDILFELKRMID